MSYICITMDGKQKRLHRHLMEQLIGRALSSNELVHHKNENTNDNRIDNLEITTRAKHIKIHGIAGYTIFKYVIDKEWLRNLYVQQQISLRQIGLRHNIPVGALQRARIRYELKRPTVYCRICKSVACYKEARLCAPCYKRDWQRGRHEKD